MIVMPRILQGWGGRAAGEVILSSAEPPFPLGLPF